MAKAKQKNPNLFTIKFKSFEEIRNNIENCGGDYEYYVNGKGDCYGVFSYAPFFECVGKEFTIDISLVKAVNRDSYEFEESDEASVSNTFGNWDNHYPWYGMPLHTISNIGELIKFMNKHKPKILIENMNIGDGNYQLSLTNHGVIKVGCQTIPKEQTKEIYKHLKKIFK